MSAEDFREMTLEEFDATAEAFQKHQEQEYRSGWEQMRLHASICIQPHLKNRVRPKELIVFPWEEEKIEKKPIPSKEEAMRQYNELMERLKQKEHGKE